MKDMASNSINDTDKIEELVYDLSQELRSPVNQDKVAIVIEGEDDILVYGKLFDYKKSFLWPAGNCLNVTNIINEMSTQKDSIIGIKDSDFDNILNITYTNTNLFCTDSHDAELLMINDSIISDIVFEHTTQHQTNIINSIFQHMEWFSYLRLYNHAMCYNDPEGNGINFEGCIYDSIYDGENPVNITSCLQEVKRLGNQDKPIYPTEETLNNFKDDYSGLNPYDLHNGHDFIKFLSIYINQKRGTGRNKVGYKNIQHEIRIAYKFDYFKQTILFEKINKWCDDRGYYLWAS